MDYVSIVSATSCCHFFLNDWRNAHKIIIRVYIWIYHTLLWLEIIFQSEWTLFDIKTTMLYLSYCHYVLKVINNWWRRDWNGNLRQEIKLPLQNWSLCWFLCWSELVWHGFDSMSLFHEYLIHGLTMNANSLGFKPHNTHNVILLPQKGKMSILFPSWVMASYLFFTSLTFLMNI